MKTTREPRFLQAWLVVALTEQQSRGTAPSSGLVYPSSSKRMACLSVANMGCREACNRGY